MAATLGALYGLLVLPAPSTLIGITPYGVAWFVLSAALLFLHPLAYHAYVFWGILWVVWRGITYVRGESTGGPVALALDLGLPTAALVLLMLSGYMAAARAHREAAA